MSVNRMYTFNRFSHQKIYKKEARIYLERNALLVANFVKKNKLKPFDSYFVLDMIFYLPRQNADSHNYKKIGLDVLERGGLVVNDKWIMDRTQAIYIDKENPRFIISFDV